MGTILTTLRTGQLNTDLGLSSDSDDRFGDTTARNLFITNAFRRLWPMMGRLVTEEVATAASTKEYTLDAIRDVERIDVLDSDGLVTGRVPTWRVLENEESDPPTLTLLVQELATEQTMRVIGYAPYTVPTTAVGSELPEDLEYIVIVGARVEAYRRRLNEFVDYKQHGADNRSTTLTPEQMGNLWTAAKREFEELVFSHRRRMSGVKRAKLTTEG